MSLAFRAAILGASAIAVIALTDAVTHGTTGRYSAFSDDYGTTRLWLAGNLTHGLAYAALAWVLFAAGQRVDAGSRGRRWVRLALASCFAVLAAQFTVGSSIAYLTDADLGSRPPVLAALLLAFPLMFVLALLLGLTMRRLPGLRPASRTLVAVVPVLGLTLLLGLLAPGFAHLAYLEITVNVGVALVGLHPSSSAGTRKGATAAHLCVRWARWFRDGRCAPSSTTRVGLRALLNHQGGVARPPQPPGWGCAPSSNTRVGCAPLLDNRGIGQRPR